MYVDKMIHFIFKYFIYDNIEYAYENTLAIVTISKIHIGTK